MLSIRLNYKTSMGKLTPHTFKKILKYKDAVETGYFAPLRGWAVWRSYAEG
jgi:hypothetical protein